MRRFTGRHGCATERILILGLMFGLGLTGLAQARVIEVSNLNDSGKGSLRQALAEARDGDEIRIRKSGRIVLSTGRLVVDKSVSITGPGAPRLAVDGEYRHQVFYIAPYHTVSLSDLSICRGNGSSYFGSGGVHNDHSTLTLRGVEITQCWSEIYGGGILNGDWSGGSATGTSTLVVLDSTIAGNLAGTGAGIGNYDGHVIIVDSTIAHNSGAQNAGGIANEGSMEIHDSQVLGNGSDWVGGIDNHGELLVLNSTCHQNSGMYDAGGILNRGDLEVGYSTFSDNRAMAAPAGAIANYAVARIYNSTISGNWVLENGGGYWGPQAGGILNNGQMQIASCTISSNTSPVLAEYAAAWAAGAILNSGQLLLGSTILHHGARGSNLVNYAGTTVSVGFNLSSDTAGGDLTSGPGGLLAATGDRRNTDPLLGPLQNNGGPTATHALLPGSPAIDQGFNFEALPFDQRGRKYLRTVNEPFRTDAESGDGTDIGAFELQRW